MQSYEKNSKFVVVCNFIVYFCGSRNKFMAQLSSEKRSKIMAAIHSCNTKPELIVRKYLWRMGFRYRVNYKRLPGHPDLVLRKYRTCIFVNGCFWHGHNCDNFRRPKTNTDFWSRKISRNRERDKAEQQQLAAMGWHVVVVWECELKPEKRKQTLESLAFTLNHIFLMDHSVGYKPVEEPEESAIAAEPPAER